MNAPHAREAQPEVTVVLPCLNEARTVAICVRKVREVCAAASVACEVVVADNGSTDGSQELATAAGARVIDVPQRGYGAAILAGIAAAHAPMIVMGDSDDSYEFADIPAFLAQLRAGAELVMGSRFRGTIHPGAMPLLHRFVGNPVLTWILNLFFGAGVSDAHCGLRAFSRAAIDRLGLRARGMEFASEMIVRAAQEKLRIAEVPTSLRPDGRLRRPHLRTWSDGWRHLRFMLLFSPLWLFVVPGLVLTVTGLVLTVVVAAGSVRLLGHLLDTHFALLGSAFAVLGMQIATLGLYAKAIFVLDGIGNNAAVRKLVSGFRLERGLLLGLFIALAGAVVDGWILHLWLDSGGGELDKSITHLAILGGTLVAVGVEIIFAAFFLSILKSSREGAWA